MTPPSLPSELKKYPWLGVLGASRFIVILYDARGTPVFGVNREAHLYSELIEGYLEEPVFSFFKLPEVSDLNFLYKDDGTEKAGRLSSVEDHLDILGETGSLDPFPKFESRNRVEPAALCPYFSVSQTLTILCLMRMERNRFLGFIYLRPVSYLIELAEKRSMLLADSNGNISGYSSLFSQPLSLRDPHELLGRPVSDAVRFSRPLSPPALPALPEMTAAVDWKAGEAPPPLRWEGWRSPEPLTGEGPLTLDNRQGMEFKFLRLEERLPMDMAHFILDVSFEATDQKIPNIVFRGRAWREGHSPDILGYALTNIQGEAGCRFRKASRDVKGFHLPALTPGKFHTVSIRRHFDAYFFLLDGRPFGHWNDTAPFHLRSDDLVYFFIRPGESLTLSSIRMAFRPYTLSDLPAETPLTATYAREDSGVRHNVTVEETVLGEQNCTIFQFHDVTTYVDNIRTLESERDTLTDILQRKVLLTGQSDGLMAVKNALPSVAQSELSVVIEGETGTGKEVLARALHLESRRKEKPFVKVDCSTLPSGLVESELFGHEAGAFTGALSRRIGLFEQAQGGTVFLDEVGNLPLDFQAKLLGVLENREIQRLGGGKPVRLNFRLIAASNVPFRALVEDGRLRQDLFYRLNQYRFSLPPLRARTEDIPLLAEQFLSEARMLYSKVVRGFNRGALEKLYLHAWPGNVRELRNAVVRAVALCAGGEIGENDVVIDAGGEGQAGRPALSSARKRIREPELTDALKKTGGHVSLAAARLNISRARIYQLFKKYGTNPKAYR